MVDATVTTMANKLLARVDELLRQASPFHLFLEGQLNDKLREKARSSFFILFLTQVDRHSSSSRLRLWADWHAIVTDCTGSAVEPNKIAEIEFSRAAVTIALAIVSPCK